MNGIRVYLLLAEWLGIGYSSICLQTLNLKLDMDFKHIYYWSIVPSHRLPQTG